MSAQALQLRGWVAGGSWSYARGGITGSPPLLAFSQWPFTPPCKHAGAQSWVPGEV